MMIPNLSKGDIKFMNYNTKCIYDILKYIETTGKTPLKIVHFKHLIENLPQYDVQTLYTHTIFCQQTYLINKLLHSIHTIEFIIGISQKGKNLLENSDSSFFTNHPLYLFNQNQTFLDF